MISVVMDRNDNILIPAGVAPAVGGAHLTTNVSALLMLAGAAPAAGGAPTLNTDVAPTAGDAHLMTTGAIPASGGRPSYDK